MTRLVALITLLLVFGTACAAYAEAPLKLGILAYRPKPQTMAQWQPLAAYLQTALKRPVELAVYNYDELAMAASKRSVDVVFTNPNHFVLLRRSFGLSAPLATLVTRDGPHELSAYGGVIITRADRRDIETLTDLSGKRIASVSNEAFGGLQMQELEMVEAGLPLPPPERLLFTGQPHDRVIEEVLAGRADVGFVRAGVIESMIREGKLAQESLKIINRRNVPDSPLAVSTRLYPEWPVAVMPQVDKELAARLAAALFLLPRNSFTGSAAAISGFTIPANYDDVENLLRRLRLPPFDRAPEITLADLWRRYAAWIVPLVGLLLLLAAASTGLVVMYRRSGRALRELEQLAEKEKLLLASLAEGMYGIDAQGNCIFINPRALAMLGFSESEVVGKDAHRLFHCRDEDDSTHPREQCPVILTLHDGQKRECEDAFVRRDGSVFPASLAVSAMRHGTAIVGTVVAFQDITARKQGEEALKDSEARFRRLAENARDAIYRMSLPDGAYEYMSPAALELFGYTPEECYASPGLVGKLIHPSWQTYFAEEWAKLLRGEMPPTYEYQIIHKSGSVRWMNQRNILVRDDNGRIIAIEGIVTDITERKATEAELLNLNEELEKRVTARTADLNKQGREISESQQALMNIVEDLNQKTEELEQANAKLMELEQLKSMFIASMSHELRTPLNSIIGFSSILLNGWVGQVNAEQQENLAIILRCGKHLLNLINDVIDVSKIETGKIESVSEEFDLHDLIAEAVSLVSRDMEEKGLYLQVVADRQQMQLDRRRLLQCLLNLLSNALKFTEKGGVTVEGRIVQKPGEPAKAGIAEISVTDTGIGIREEDLPKMCLPFVRLASPLQATVPGTGLGLYLSRKLAAEVLKGDILFASEYGKGSRFTIRIPVRIP